MRLALWLRTGFSRGSLSPWREERASGVQSRFRDLSDEGTVECWTQHADPYFIRVLRRDKSETVGCRIFHPDGRRPRSAWWTEST